MERNVVEKGVSERAPGPRGSATDVSEVVEDHMAQFMSWLYSSPYSRVEDEREFLRLTSDVRDPMCNFILRLRFDDRDVEERMDNMMEFFRSRGLPTSCWAGPCCTPSRVGDMLVSHGFVHHQDLESVGMTMDLGNLNEEVQVAEGLAVRKVLDRDGMRSYLSALEKGFEFTETVADQWGKMDASHGFDPGLPRINYFATVDGTPASCVTLFKTSTSAGIYCVATIKEMRRKGAATALIVRALVDARDEGYRTGLLHAKAMGASMYRKIGFVDQPCRFGWYTWEPPGPAH